LDKSLRREELRKGPSGEKECKCKGRMWKKKNGHANKQLEGGVNKSKISPNRLALRLSRGWKKHRPRREWGKKKRQRIIQLSYRGGEDNLLHESRWGRKGSNGKGGRN